MLHIKIDEMLNIANEYGGEMFKSSLLHIYQPRTFDKKLTNGFYTQFTLDHVRFIVEHM